MTVFIVDDTYIMAPKSFSWKSPTLLCFSLLLQQNDSLRRKTKIFNKSKHCKTVFEGKSFFMISANCHAAEYVPFLFQYFVPSWVNGLMGTMVYFPLDPTVFVS